jgi:hypothetical protein
LKCYEIACSGYTAVIWGCADSQTKMANVKYATLKLIIQKNLRIVAALANHPAIPEVTTISQLTLPLEKQGKACGKEAELDHSSYFFFTPCPHEPLTRSAQNERPHTKKKFQRQIS